MRPHNIITLQPQYIQTSQLIEPCRVLETTTTIQHTQYTQCAISTQYYTQYTQCAISIHSIQNAQLVDVSSTSRIAYVTITILLINDLCAFSCHDVKCKLVMESRRSI